MKCTFAHADLSAFTLVKVLLNALLLLLIPYDVAGQARLAVDLDQEGKEISTELIGAFFEDINYAADGGLYAELVQNRSFEYFRVPRYVNLEPLQGWEIVKKDGARAAISIEDENPLNENNRDGRHKEYRI